MSTGEGAEHPGHFVAEQIGRRGLGLRVLAVTRQTPGEDPRARRVMNESGLCVICAPKPTRRACAREHSGLCRLIARTVGADSATRAAGVTGTYEGPGMTTPDAVLKAPVTAAEEFDRPKAQSVEDRQH